MGVLDPIDTTPEFTMSTVQFENEVVNVVISSLLAVLIIANIGSTISKLVYFSRDKDFSYRSWVRAYIFANSDDPLRIFSWISRNYVYRPRNWARHRNKLCWGRLVVPLLARGFILIVSVVSIGITIPGNKALSGCSRGDYALVMNETMAEFKGDRLADCLDIPLSSRRGKLLVKASYCNCLLLTLGSEGPAIRVKHDNPDGSIEWSVSDNESTYGFRSYVEWKQNDVKNVFRSELSRTVDIDSHMRVAIKAVGQVMGQECIGETKVINSAARETSLENCDFLVWTPARLIEVIESYVRNGLQWKRTPEVQRRVQITDQNEWKSNTTCVTNIVVSRPIVNILPLLITLIGLVIVNLIVTLAVSRHGNALDAGFHLIKEALGHDCTSNALEENVEREEVKELSLRSWKCGIAGAHRGFIGRTGDIPIEGFRDDVTGIELNVCGCSRVVEEIGEARVMVDSTTPQYSNSPSSLLQQSQTLQDSSFSAAGV